MVPPYISLLQENYRHISQYREPPKSVPPYFITAKKLPSYSITARKLPPYFAVPGTAEKVPPYLSTTKKEIRNKNPLFPFLFPFHFFFLYSEKSSGSVVFLFGRASFSHLTLLSPGHTHLLLPTECVVQQNDELCRWESQCY